MRAAGEALHSAACGLVCPAFSGPLILLCLCGVLVVQVVVVGLGGGSVAEP
jgi:hypothetical protein